MNEGCYSAADDVVNLCCSSTLLDGTDAVVSGLTPLGAPESDGGPLRARSRGLDLGPLRARSGGLDPGPLRARSRGLDLAPLRARSRGLDLAPLRAWSGGLLRFGSRTLDWGRLGRAPCGPVDDCLGGGQVSPLPVPHWRGATQRDVRTQSTSQSQDQVHVVSLRPPSPAWNPYIRSY